MYQPGVFRLAPAPAVVAPAVVRREDVNALLPRREHYTASRWEKLKPRARRLLYVAAAEEWRTRREAERHDWNRLVDAQMGAAQTGATQMGAAQTGATQMVQTGQGAAMPTVAEEEGAAEEANDKADDEETDRLL